MGSLSKVTDWLVRALACLAMVAWITGCASDSPSGSSGKSGSSGNASADRRGVDLLKKGDLVTVFFSGVNPPPSDQEERIKDDGTINLQLIGAVKAEGLTPGELQKKLQESYVPKYYRRLTVTVKTENRMFYVDGEVRRPDRLTYQGEVSVLKAIAAAGGFTDFAARGRIQLVRATGEKISVDGRKAANDSKYDPPVLPGDRIFVPRRSPFGR